MCVPPIRMVHPGTPLQGSLPGMYSFKDIIIEHKGYYDKSVQVIVDTILL